MTTPAAAISVFIGTMDSRGFSDNPPVSKVIPLPTITMCLVSLPASAGV